MSPDNASQGIGSSPDGERRLWFDYIAKLNDRSIQTNRESGATNWVLLGVAVAIVYKSVPQLSYVLSTSEVLKSALEILLLEINALIFFGIAIFLLVYFSAGKNDRRLVPTTHAPVQQILRWFGIVAFITLTVAGVWLSIIFGVRPTWVRWVLAVSSVWWGLNISLALKKMFRTSQAAKKLGVPVPRFMGMAINSDSGVLTISAIHALLGLIPAAALFTYLRDLNRSQAGWVTPLSAATHALVLFGVVAVLLSRLFRSVHSSAFLNLERAILLENLTPVEIRSRFVTQLLGTSAGDWLTEIMNGIKSADAKLRACADSIRERLPNVESVEPQYALERKGRAKKLLDELVAAISEHRSTLQKYQFQLSEYVKVAGSKEETEILKRMAADLEAWVIEVKVHAASTADLVKLLTSF
jgi:hypothetical protein